MKIKALISFSGAISMQVGETRDISNQEIVKDLIEAGYVKTVGKVENIEEKVVSEEVADENKEVVTDED